MKQSFEKTFELNSFKKSHNQHGILVTLIDCFNDTAVSHSKSLGYSLESLFKKGYAWILLFWNIEVQQLPRFGEKISIETWISQIRRSFAYREFLLKNNLNKVQVQASSKWLFYHIHRKRPVKIFLDLSNQWKIIPEQACHQPIMSLDFLQSVDDQDREEIFSVQREDIDILNHVHNSKYIDWIMKIKPDTIQRQYRLKHLQAWYHHEIKYPGKIIVTQKRFFPEEDDKKLFYNAIRDKNQQRIAAEITTQWHDAHSLSAARCQSNS